MPLAWLYFPLRKQARLGEQRELTTNALRKRTPSAARRSMFGVLNHGNRPLSPCSFWTALMASYRWSSANIKTKFGRSAAAASGAEASRTAAVRIERDMAAPSASDERCTRPGGGVILMPTRDQVNDRLLSKEKSAMITDRRHSAALALAAVALMGTPAVAADPLVFISAFAPGEKGGIHAYEFDGKTGELEPVHRTGGVENPFFLAFSPDRKYLYSIHAREFGGKENEQVAAYQVVGRTGELKPLNRRSAEGIAACYLDVDQTGKTL